MYLGDTLTVVSHVGTDHGGTVVISDLDEAERRTFIAVIPEGGIFP